MNATSKGYTCSAPKCGHNITAYGPLRRHAEFLRRVDWALEGGKALYRDHNPHYVGESR